MGLGAGQQFAAASLVSYQEVVWYGVYAAKLDGTWFSCKEWVPCSACQWKGRNYEVMAVQNCVVILWHSRGLNHGLNPFCGCLTLVE